VRDEELSALYSRCFAFVFPSLYEGFGLPVLEAMSCGAPVILSRSTSLPEVAGEAGFYIDPASEASLRDQMTQLTEKRQRREEWRQASRAQASGFSWEHAARVTLQAYETACSREPWFVSGREPRG
jgi:glycosyltransferase involved in cell wall biosynthesis